jgi:hypothetical protein
VLFVLAQVHTATAAEITGRVGITDGDTLTVQDEARRQTSVRLAEIAIRRTHQPVRRAINAEPSEPLPGMVKRQCPECRYWFAAAPATAEPRCPDCVAFDSRPAAPV